MKRIVPLTLLAALTLGGCASDPTPAAPPTEPTTSAPSVNSTAAIWPDEDFRASQPEAGPTPELKVPEVERFTLNNGLEVYLVKQERLPTLYVSMQFDVGGVGDSSKKTGMTSMCLDLLDEGTKSKDKVAFEAAQADKAVSVWSGGGGETSTVNGRALVRDADAMFELAAEMMLKPGLRQKDLDRLKKQARAGLKQRTASPSGVAGRLFPSLIYGASHPYGRFQTEASIDAVKLGDCKKTLAKLKPGGARMFVVGMIDKGQIEAAFDRHFAKWKGKQRADKTPGAGTTAAGKVHLVHVPKAAQSMIMVGHQGPRRDDPEYAANAAMMAVLGGGFTSRLNMNLREDKGFAYGARGGMRYWRDGGFVRLSSSVETTTTAAALREMEKEMREITGSRPPTDDELQREKDAVMLAMPARFATPTSALGRFRSLAYYGLPLDWDRTYQQQVQALGLESVLAAAKKQLKPDAATVLVVGDATVIKADLEKLVADGVFGAKTLEVVDADGRPAKLP